jgi:hypothetical protein
MKTGLLIFFIMLVSATVFGQVQPVVKLEVEPTECAVGDRILYTLSVTRPATGLVKYPSDSDAVAFYPFEILSKKVLSDEKSGESITEKLQYTLAVYDTGESVIPPLTLTYLSGKPNDSTLFETDSRKIKVRSVLDTTQKDILDIKPVQTLSIPWWVWLLIVLVLAVIIGGGYWLVQRWQKQPAAPKEKLPPQKEPYQIALEKLEAMEKLSPETQQEFKQYYSSLSEILREFIEKHYRVPALEQTTSEIDYALRRKLTALETEKVRTILESADLVKFAKFYPSLMEAKENLSRTRECVRFGAPKQPTPTSVQSQPQSEKGEAANV